MHYVTIDTLLKEGCLIGENIKNTGTTHSYPLYQKSKNTSPNSQLQGEPIVCQTTWMRLPMKPRYIVKRNKRVYFITLSFGETKEHRDWLLFLKQFQRVLQTVPNRNKKHRGVYTWINMLEQSPSYAFLKPGTLHTECKKQITPMWKITTALSTALRCYDIHQNVVPIRDFLSDNTHRHIRLIVQFSHVWVNETSHTAGVAVDVLQMQQHASYPPPHFSFTNTSKPSRTVGTQTDKCTLVVVSDITDTETSRPMTTASSSTTDGRCDHPLYGKYFKMLKKRVPKPAVQHKMRMNGLDPDILNWDASKPLPNTNDDCGLPVDQLSLSLQDDRQLRKTETNAHEKKAPDGAGHGFSLDEIVNGLNSLRKTFMGSGKSSSTNDANDVNKKELNIDGRIEACKKSKSRQVVSTKKKNNSSFMKLLGATFGS